jgi:hypothetical protein
MSCEDGNGNFFTSTWHSEYLFGLFGIARAVDREEHRVRLYAISQIDFLWLSASFRFLRHWPSHRKAASQQ